MNQYYDNEFISNEVEDALNSHLDLTRFCTINNDLVGVAGDRIKFNVYSATNGTQILDLGEGNTISIQTRLTSEEYRILLAQNRFDYYDEEQMRDPNVVPVGIDKAAKDLYNTEQDMIYGEFLKAPQLSPLLQLSILTRSLMPLPLWTFQKTKKLIFSL